MANTRIADLPSATVINDSTYVAIDSYGTEGTAKATPMQVCSMLITEGEIVQIEAILNINTVSNNSASPALNVLLTENDNNVEEQFIEDITEQEIEEQSE